MKTVLLELKAKMTKNNIFKPMKDFEKNKMNNLVCARLNAYFFIS